MPKIKNRKPEDYDFTQPIKVVLSEKNLPRFELDLKPVYPKAESELERDSQPFEYGRLPQTIAKHRVATFKAGKTVVRVEKRAMTESRVEPIIVTKQSLAFDQDMAILAWGREKNIKAKRY